MKNKFQLVKLKDIVNPVNRGEEVRLNKIYRQIGVRLWGEGAYERESIEGSQTKYKTLFRAEGGDIIVNKIWARNGSVAVVQASLAGCYGSNEFPMFSPIPNKLDSRWIHWITKTPDFWGQCDQMSQGTSGKNRIRPEKFLEVEIPLPPLEEQRRIVARIKELETAIGEARGLRKQSLEETDFLSSRSLSSLFDYIYPDKLISNWEWKNLEEILINKKEGIITGPFGTLLQKSDIQLSGVPVLGIANVQANRFVPGFTEYVSKQKSKQLDSYRLKGNDIVIARSGTVGRSCLVPLIFSPLPIMSTNLIRLRLNDKVFLPELLCRLFNGSNLVEQHKYAECRGSTRSFFTQKILLKLRIPVPPLSEQHRIVAYLEALQAKIDSLKRLQAETAAELDALLPSILDRAFKGEL